MDVFLCVYVCLILNFPLEKLVFASNCLRQETKSLIFKEPIPNYLCSKNGCLPIINVRKLQKKSSLLLWTMLNVILPIA